MDKGYESILRCLEENEKIIFTTDKNFKFGEKNLLVKGEKFFCISNFGKIYIADKNRFLRGVKVIVYDYKERGVKFNVLNKENIIAINSRDFTDNRSESFIINIKLDDFTEISKKLVESPFIYNWSKYSVKIDGGVYESALIEVGKECISINTLSYKVNLDYLDIVDFKEKDNSLHIISRNSKCYNILIYAFNEDVSSITNAIKKAKNILEYDDAVLEENFEDNNDKTMILDNSVDTTVIDVDGSFRKEIDKTLSEYYKNEILNYKKKDLISSYGKLYGVLNSINYKGRQVEVIVDDELKIFDKELNKELVSIGFNDYRYTKNDTIIILKKEDNMILINLEEEDLDLDKFMTNHISNTEYVGYTNELMPFEVVFSEKEMILSHFEKSIVKIIKFDEIADINILESVLNFESIAITLTNSEICKIFMLRSSVVNILRDVYRLKSHKKYTECSQSTRENTFKNMINDELAILYFGDIVKMKNTIDDFYKSEIKNRKVLVENLYNISAKIQKSCKIISMYYFEKFNTEFDYRMLNIIRSLKDIEKDILNLTDNIFISLNNLESVKTIIKNNKIKTVLDNDMTYILEDIGLKTEDCIYKTITLNSDIFDYNFDETIKDISLFINNFLSIKTLYYSRLIKVLVDEIAIEKYITNEEIIDELINYFVRMQLKSKIDNRTRLKDVLINIKKYTEYKKKITNSDSIDILNLVTF